MKQQAAKRNNPPRTGVITWIVIAAFAAALLAACGGDDGGTSAPGAVITPPPVLDDDGTPLPEQPDFRESLLMRLDDVRDAAYSPDGTQIALSSGDTIWLFTPELEQVRQLKGHTGAVRALAWSPDGTRIASAALDNTARIWEADSGSLLTRLTGHTDWVMDVAWSPDGTRLVTASTDHTLRVWDADSGDEVTQLGSSRVESILVTFSDAGTFDTIADMDYAQTILETVESEPLSGLAAQVAEQDYSVTIAFADPAQAERLLRLNDTGYGVRITTDDDEIDEQLAALNRDQLIDLIMLVDDQQAVSLLAEYSAAEAVIAAINARDDIDMIRIVQRLQREEVVIVIEQVGGETTTANPADEDFIATIADLNADDITISFGIENGAEIAAHLQDPDFVAAVQALDAAQATVTALTERDDAALLLLARDLQTREYTVALTNDSTDLNDELSTLDKAATMHLIDLLHNTDLLATLTRLAAVDYVISDLDTYNIGELSGVLAPLDDYVVITVHDPALMESIKALSAQEATTLARLLEDSVLRYAMNHMEDAQATLDEIAARDDFALISTLRKLENPRTVETIISALPGSDDVRVSRKRNEADYVLTFALAGEDTFVDLSALDNDTLAEQFATQDAATVSAQIEAGIYALAPALEPDDIAVVMDLITSEMFTVSVQREANAHIDSVTSVGWSSPGGIIASTSTDLTMRLWTPDSGVLAASIDLDEMGIALAWSPDGTLLANGGWTNSVVLWDVRDGAEAAEDFEELKGGDERILTVVWSPDGTTIAAGGRDGMLFVWDVASGDELLSVSAHAGETRAVAWSPDGGTILTAGTDGFVRLWPVEAAPGN